MPHRLKGLGLEVKGRLLVTVIRGNTSMVMWLYTAVKQTPSTCLHSTLHSHVCARSQTISPCSRPTSSSFQLDIQLLPWPHTMNSFQRRSPTLYYTVCVCVYECHSVIPTVGLIFFSSLKKEKRGGPPSFPALGPCGQPWFLFFLPPSGAHLLLLYFCSQPTLRSTLYSTAYPFISPFEASLICSHDWSFFPTPCINKLLKTVYIWNTPYTIQLASNPSQHALACSTTAASSVSHACAHTPLRNVHALKKNRRRKK